MDLTLAIELILTLAAIWSVFLVIFWLLRPKDLSTRELVRIIPDVVRLLRSVITDRRCPPDVRVVMMVLMFWIISPIDLIPEFVPGIGPLDDVIVAILALRYTRRRMGVDDLRKRWTGTPDGFALLTRVIGSA